MSAVVSLWIALRDVFWILLPCCLKLVTWFVGPGLL